MKNINALKIIRDNKQKMTYNLSNNYIRVHNLFLTSFKVHEEISHLLPRKVKLMNIYYMYWSFK